MIAMHVRDLQRGASDISTTASITKEIRELIRTYGFLSGDGDIPPDGTPQSYDEEMIELDRKRRAEHQAILDEDKRNEVPMIEADAQVVNSKPEEKKPEKKKPAKPKQPVESNDEPEGKRL